MSVILKSCNETLNELLDEVHIAQNSSVIKIFIINSVIEFIEINFWIGQTEFYKFLTVLYFFQDFEIYLFAVKHFINMIYLADYAIKWGVLKVISQMNEALDEVKVLTTIS